MIKRSIVNRRNRRRMQQSQGALASPVTLTVTLGSQTPKQINVATSEPVSISGVPATFLLAGNAPTAITVTDATHFTLAYATPPATGQSWAFAALDPAIRSYSGGVNAASAGTF
jgi:hypothetical protein